MLIVIVLGCAGALLAVGVSAVLIPNRVVATRFVYGTSMVFSVVLLGVAIGGLTADSVRVTLPLGLPWLGAHFQLDALAAFFLAVINLGGAMASLYGIGYGTHEETPGRVLPFYPVFLAGMNLVVLAADAFTFLLSWEFMSLASWALVLSHHRDAGNTRAAFIYLVMASFGTACLLLAFGLLAGPQGGYAFDTIRNAGGLAPIPAALVLFLALLGTGSKAGLVPLHVWLPLAHPAAPSHVSALMSGVMTKVAVYGFIRIVFDLLGFPAWWWGLAVLALGGATAVLGVLQALMQRDIKRLLAYSTIENLGIVYIGLGLTLAFRTNHMDAIAALAMTAALLHVFNHSLFKSLLFFGAGAVLNATGVRNIERLGGLIHRMPTTSLVFLVGSASIAALPPFNGFVSEWLTFQAVLLSPDIPQWGLKLMIPAVGALLALAAALAGACFVRAFGMTFLGRPRSDVAQTAQEADGFSRLAMILLAVLCLVGGIFPGLLIDLLSPVVASLLGGRMPSQIALPWLSIVPMVESQNSYNGLLVFLFIVISATLAVAAIHRFASRATRRSGIWDCGYPDPSPVTQYTADSFGQPIRRVYGSVFFGARERVEMPVPGDPRPSQLRVSYRDFVWDFLYAPIVTAVSFLAEKLNYLQFLTIRRYLSLVFLALVLLLLVLAIWS